MGRHGDLVLARNARRDEFYTQACDIEAELRHYADRFRGKSVYCNCDDPIESEFWRFLLSKLRPWGLARLTATYRSAGPDIPAYAWNAVADDSLPDCVRVSKTPLVGNGDFRSDECVDLLDRADIVVTNPPFSLFREYIAQLVAHGKEFLVIGNVNAITYKDFFPLVQADKIWIGPSIRSGDREFRVPDDYPLAAAGCRTDEHGRKYIRVKGVRWFTNMDVPQRHVPLDLSGRRYEGHEAEYPVYDNCDAINIDRVADIPGDYYGTMGVPITFLDKYCPEQFEILGFRKGDDGRDLVFTRDGVRVQPYFRILVRRRAGFRGAERM